MPAGLPGEAVDLAEAEPGALADRLGREERLEDLGEDGGRHALAGVADADHGVVAGLDLAGGGEIGGGADDAVSRLDDQRPAARHRIARVHR